MSRRWTGIAAIVGSAALMVALTAASGALPTATAMAQAAGGDRAEQSQTLALAVQLERSGQAEEAERVLIELLGSQPAAPRALSMLARLTAARGAPEAVLPYAEVAADRAGYEQAVIHQTYIRALAASGRGSEALEVAREWVARRPSDVSGYAELSHTLSTVGRHGDAVQALHEGRAQANDADLFAQELAVLHESAGRYEEAAEEWLAVLAWGDAGVGAVETRLRTPGVDREAVLAAIESSLGRPSAGIGALRGGLDLALRLGHAEEARRLAGQVVERAPAETRRQVLRRYHADALRAGETPDARWAAARLAADAPDERQRLHWEAVEAGLARELGDAAHAREAFERILGAASDGDDTRRLAIVNLVVLRADEDDARAEELIELHADEYPGEEAERADLAIELSRARVRRGDLGAARRALEHGPGQPDDAAVASRLEAQRGRLALYEGRVSAATGHLETAGRIPGGDSGGRTTVLLQLEVFSRADSADVAELGGGVYALRRDGDPAVLEASVERWAARGGAPSASAGLIRLAAGALEGEGFVEPAAAARQRLVDAFPETSEATGALLALARAELPDRPDGARRWLERLIIEHPDSALAPVARRMLAEIDRAVRSGDGNGPPEASS